MQGPAILLSREMLTAPRGDKIEIEQDLDDGRADHHGAVYANWPSCGNAIDGGVSSQREWSSSREVKER